MAKLVNIQHIFECPTDFTPDQRVMLADLIIKKIKERCSDGLKATGGSFPHYSPEYKASLDFKNAGKSGDVNLRLSGDMLAEMRLVRHSVGKIVIGYDKGDVEADKVEGNQIGSYGKPIGDPNKARPFLGLPQGILDALISKVKKELPELSVAKDKTDSFINSILKNTSTKFGK